MTISTNDLIFSYSGGKSFVFPDLHCSKNENLLIHGTSGSGKTTLLHIIAGIIRPGKGSISINGTIVSGLTAKEMDAFRGKHIGMIFQQHYFFQGMDVFENLLAAQKLPGSKPDKQHLYALMHDLDIFNLKDSKPETLSQGEQQRFSIARALANKPLLVLADEPTSSLDDQNCLKFIEMMRSSVNNYETSWIIATHDNRLKEHFNHIYSL